MRHSFVGKVPEKFKVYTWIGGDRTSDVEIAAIA